MKHKTIAKIAIFMVVVFGATILLYPTLFGPELKRGETPIEAPPTATPPTVVK